MSWDAIDDDGDTLTHNLLYSPDNGGSWLPVAVNLTEPSFEFESNQVPSSNGGPARFRVRTSDGFNNGEAEEVVALGLGDGNPPLVYLIAPNDGDVFPQHACVILHAAAWDMEDLMLADDQIVWISNLDGLFGTGVELPYSGLSAGTHTLTVIGTDSGGLETFDSKVVTITPRTIFSPDMNGDGVVDGADLGLLLANWGGSGSGDLNMDGTIDGSDLGLLLAAWG